jgi:hypothetical protein
VEMELPLHVEQTGNTVIRKKMVFMYVRSLKITPSTTSKSNQRDREVIIKDQVK